MAARERQLVCRIAFILGILFRMLIYKVIYAERNEYFYHSCYDVKDLVQFTSVPLCCGLAIV